MTNTKIPQVGDVYWPNFESDYPEDPLYYNVIDTLTLDQELLVIQEVGMLYDDNIGWEILASDGYHYDCYWSDKLGIWVYSTR